MKMLVSLQVNGDPVEVAVSPEATLTELLRRELGLTGTKEGCGEGECGACTVLLDGEPVLSCLVPLMQCRGREVQTVEAVAAGSAAPFVERFVAAGGVQCGACTPGIVVTAAALLEREAQPDRSRVQEALAGNLCRCTGYEGIFRTFEEEGE